MSKNIKVYIILFYMKIRDGEINNISITNKITLKFKNIDKLIHGYLTNS